MKHIKFVFMMNILLGLIIDMGLTPNKSIPMQYMLGGVITVFIVMVITYGLMQLAGYANDSKN